MEGAKVQLVVTCLVDALSPQVGRAALAVLESAGCDVEFPEAQTCCGQPAFNVGLLDPSLEMAAHTLDVLDSTEGAVVLPSGSCAEMIIHHYPELFVGTDREAQAQRVAERTRELTQFLVDDLDAEIFADCGDCAVAFHHSCHGLRGLGLDHQADALIPEGSRVALAGEQECCGFGGLFSVEMPAVSGAILAEKLDSIEASGADVLAGGDISCLLHIQGGLRRRGSKIQVRHISKLLAGETS